MGFSAITPPPRSQDAHETLLEFPDNRLLIDLCGEFDRNLAQIEHKLQVHILRRGNQLAVVGEPEAQLQAAAVLHHLYQRLEQGLSLDAEEVDAALRMADLGGTGTSMDEQLEMFEAGKYEIRTRKKHVEPRTEAQKAYVRHLFENELAFGIGPAGTGKTYLAVAVGVTMLIGGHVDKIILSRPAVEAGERLGFLPGDMKDKVDPYMQPLYDALNDFLPAKQLAKLTEEKRIEIAPLAFMRGRTLSNAFVVLDEAQNATTMQMNQDSTSQIVDIVGQLQANTSKMGLSSRDCQSGIAQCVSQVNEAGSQISEIEQSVDNIAQMSTQIATACSEQNSVSEELNRSVEQINFSSTEMAEGASQTVVACQQISSLAHNLKARMESFKL